VWRGRLQWAASVGDSLEAHAGAVQGESGVTRQKEEEGARVVLARAGLLSEGHTG
jgi:hypothetical protein